MANANQHHRPPKRRRVMAGYNEAAAASIAGLTTEGDALDLGIFLDVLKNEVGELQSCMKDSKDAKMERAFQQVPRSLRRRTASHNAKRLPRRLRTRAEHDQAADNTPSLASTLAKRKKTRPSSTWVYENTKRRVQEQKEAKLLSRKFKAMEDEGCDEKMSGAEEEEEKDEEGKQYKTGEPLPFELLPIDNLRLPTHMWHARRAEMGSPGPLWHNTVVKTPSDKTYRQTARTAGMTENMCVCWDTSYTATILLRGPLAELQQVLAGVVEPHLLRCSEVRKGMRCLDVKLPRSYGYQTGSDEHRRYGEMGGPGNCGAMTLLFNPVSDKDKDNKEREAFLRVHPMIFSHVWTTLIKTAKEKYLDKAVQIVDFRYEIGSIEVTGSSGLELLLETLYPVASPSMEPQARDFLRLHDLDTNVLSTTQGYMLTMNIQDPRLDRPEESTEEKDDITPPKSSIEQLEDWPSHKQGQPSGLFDSQRRKEAASLQSTARMDKRRGKLGCGEQLLASINNQPIPVILTAPGAGVPVMATPQTQYSTSATWTLLLPRGCVEVVWRCMNNKVLPASGRHARFGGLEERQHLALERGKPFFPADFPGTPAGWHWELQSRSKHETTWNNKPPAKRVAWKSVNLGKNSKSRGEIGSGFACDWELLFGVKGVSAEVVEEDEGEAEKEREKEKAKDKMDMDNVDLVEEVHYKALQQGDKKMPDIVRHMHHVTLAEVYDALAAVRIQEQPHWTAAYPLLTVSLQTVGRGVPGNRARIYRLPSDAADRALWLAKANEKNAKPLTIKKKIPPPPKRMPPGIQATERKRLLAKSLLETRLPYPAPQGENNNDNNTLPIPSADDLLGFVTSGALRFRAGQGSGIGHVHAQKLVETIVAADENGNDAQRRVSKLGSREARFCIVRNVGETVGWLAKWTPISH